MRAQKRQNGGKRKIQDLGEKIEREERREQNRAEFLNKF